MSTIKQTVLKALEQYKGDNLYRAEAAFKHLSQKELNREYGQSGQTHQQIIDDYKKHEEKVHDAIIWINTL